MQAPPGPARHPPRGGQHAAGAAEAAEAPTPAHGSPAGGHLPLGQRLLHPGGVMPNPPGRGAEAFIQAGRQTPTTGFDMRRVFVV